MNHTITASTPITGFMAISKNLVSFAISSQKALLPKMQTVPKGTKEPSLGIYSQSTTPVATEVANNTAAQVGVSSSPATTSPNTPSKTNTD